MQQTQQPTEPMNSGKTGGSVTGGGLGTAGGLDTAERRRVETVVETLATLHGRSETLAEVAHDARNMVTALGLYCELLDEPGVLAPQFRHYGNELRLVAAASRRLVEKLTTLDAGASDAAHHDKASGSAVLSSAVPPSASPAATVSSSHPAYNPFERGPFGASSRWETLPAVPIRNLAREVLASRNLLAALAGPAIILTVDAEGGALPVWLTGEDLTRVLVNLVRNAAEAMPADGRIRIALRETIRGEQSAAGATGPSASSQSAASPGASSRVESLALTVEDNGPGIPAEVLEAVFASGYTRHPAGAGHSASHRGLGLAISRSIVEAAGGRIRALRREASGTRSAGTLLPATDSTGACFEIVLPVAYR